jgi:hypothetical protein
MARRRDRVAIVLMDHALRADPELPDFAARNRVTVAVDDLEIDPWDRCAHRIIVVRFVRGYVVAMRPNSRAP